jgi:hypothetical protein
MKKKSTFGFMLFIYSLTGKIFLSAGLKYQDTTVSISNSNAGNNSLTGSPDTRCENIAPDIIKKKPA